MCDAQSVGAMLLKIVPVLMAQEPKQKPPDAIPGLRDPAELDPRNGPLSDTAGEIRSLLG